MKFNRTILLAATALIACSRIGVEEMPRPVVKMQEEIVSENDKPAMCRQYVIDGKQLEIAYINYNKVRITKEGQKPEIHEFETSKDAVDYYVQKMHEFEPDEE